MDHHTGKTLVYFGIQHRVWTDQIEKRLQKDLVRGEKHEEKGTGLL